MDRHRLAGVNVFGMLQEILALAAAIAVSVAVARFEHRLEAVTHFAPWNRLGFHRAHFNFGFARESRLPVAQTIHVAPRVLAHDLLHGGASAAEAALGQLKLFAGFLALERAGHRMLRTVLVERLVSIVGVFEKDPSIVGRIFLDKTDGGAGSRGFEILHMRHRADRSERSQVGAMRIDAGALFAKQIVGVGQRLIGAATIAHELHRGASECGRNVAR